MEMVVKKFLCRLITTLQDLQLKDILLVTVADLDQPGRLGEAQYHLEKTCFQIRYKYEQGRLDIVICTHIVYVCCVNQLNVNPLIFRLETMYCIFHLRLEVWTHTMTQMVYLVAKKLITKSRLYLFLYWVVSLYYCFI